MEELKKKVCNCEEEEVKCHCDEACHCDDDCACDDCDCEEDSSCGHHKKEHHDKKHKDKDKYKKEMEALKEENKALEEMRLRDKAELVNYRKRKDEEVARMLMFANEDLIRELLPVVDNFERAIKMDDLDLTDEVSKFLTGFKMIYCNLLDILKHVDVMEIDGVNKPFDPAYHQAVMTDKVDGVEPNMVIEVLQKGYLYKGKIIRPAMVKVSE